MDTKVLLHICGSVAAVGILLASLESMSRRDLLTDDQFASWVVMRSSVPWFSSSLFTRTLGWLFTYPRVLLLHCARIIGGVAVLVGSDGLQLPAVAVIAVGSILLNLRAAYGHDGADQLLVIVFATLTIAYLVPTEPVRVAALLFLGAQAGLAYLVAGAAKLSSATWRSGRAIPGILGTEIYGHAWAGSLTQRFRSLALISAWTVMGFECAFIVALGGWLPLTLTFLALGVGFHLVNAVVMRLNTFLWAFLATYPAVLFTSYSVASLTAKI